ncbi:MAG: HAMP domain-containing histidine kinase [Gammaproteobacteria bacterium]|nr:HAMP domain-containing histidine kinase [Gammaproteobacteria bacterium]
MWEIALECFRTLAIAATLYFAIRFGNNLGFNSQRGWKLVLTGWSFILLGSILDITDNFPSLNPLIVVGNTSVEAFLEIFIGIFLGYGLFFIGVIIWLPAIGTRTETLKHEFVSTVSHELRTPLTAIYGAIKLVYNEVPGSMSPQAKETLKIALNNSVRLNHLVNDILDIEKLDNGKMVFNMKPENVLDMVKEAMQANQHYGETYSVSFHLDPASIEARVRVDAQRFNQIMNNLLSNAAKFSRKDSHVDILVSRQGDVIRIAISDSGEGIKMESYPLIFQRFSQLNRDDRYRLGGSGLGLAITKQFVEKMGGDIGFDSVVGSGTTFYVDFPEVIA